MVVTTVLTGRVSSADRLPIPGQQVADAIDGMVGDAGEHVAQISLWIELAHLGGLDQGIDRGRANAAGIGAGKKIVFPSHRQWPDRPFGGIVGHLQSAVGGVARQRRPARDRVTNRLCELALAADLAQRLLQEGFKLGQKRNGLLLAYGQALGWCVALDPRLDREQLGDALQRFLGHRRRRGFIDVVELAASVRLIQSSG